MKIIVQGISIELTKSQVDYIEKEKAKQLKECTTFIKTLKSFGFKKMSTKGWANPNSNCWETKDWFIEIFDNEQCMVTGVGVNLDSSGWPLTTWSPIELVKILNKALDFIENETNKTTT